MIRLKGLVHIPPKHQEYMIDFCRSVVHCAAHAHYIACISLSHLIPCWSLDPPLESPLEPDSNLLVSQACGMPGTHESHQLCSLHCKLVEEDMGLSAPVRLFSHAGRALLPSTPPGIMA